MLIEPVLTWALVLQEALPDLVAVLETAFAKLDARDTVYEVGPGSLQGRDSTGWPAYGSRDAA